MLLLCEDFLKKILREIASSYCSVIFSYCQDWKWHYKSADVLLLIIYFLFDNFFFAKIKKKEYKKITSWYCNVNINLYFLSDKNETDNSSCVLYSFADTMTHSELQTDCLFWLDAWNERQYV